MDHRLLAVVAVVAANDFQTRCPYERADTMLGLQDLGARERIGPGEESGC